MGDGGAASLLKVLLSGVGRRYCDTTSPFPLHTVAGYGPLVPYSGRGRLVAGGSRQLHFRLPWSKFAGVRAHRPMLAMRYRHRALTRIRRNAAYSLS